MFCNTGAAPCRRFCWNKYDDEWVVTTSSEHDPQYHTVAAISASATGALPSGEDTWAVLRCNEEMLQYHDMEIVFAEFGNLALHTLTLVRGAEADAVDERQMVTPHVCIVRCCNVTVTHNVMTTMLSLTLLDIDCRRLITNSSDKNILSVK